MGATSLIKVGFWELIGNGSLPGKQSQSLWMKECQKVGRRAVDNSTFQKKVKIVSNRESLFNLRNLGTHLRLT